MKIDTAVLKSYHFSVLVRLASGNFGVARLFSFGEGASAIVDQVVRTATPTKRN